MTPEQHDNPRFVEPMLATRVRELPTGAGWEYEVKWDGYRIVAVKKRSGGATVFAKGGEFHG